MRRLAIVGFVVAALAGCAVTPEPPSTSFDHAIAPQDAGERSWIGGVARDRGGHGVVNALIVLEGDFVVNPGEDRVMGLMLEPEAVDLTNPSSTLRVYPG